MSSYTTKRTAQTSLKIAIKRLEYRLTQAERLMVMCQETLAILREAQNE